MIISRKHIGKTIVVHNLEGLFRLDSSVSNDGVKHDALVLEDMFINQSNHTGRAGLLFLYNSREV